MHEYIDSHTRLEDASGEVVSVVALDYEHGDVVSDLHRIQHEYDDLIETTTHTHEGEWCLETVFCRGDASRVRSLVYRLRDFDDVARAAVVLLRPERE